jgi:AcrR family transcriptional regulator
MPRFSLIEEENIRKELLQKGTMLFTKYGLNKVSIDDIVNEVKIAKATFYKFYESKEAFYFEILLKERKELFEQLNLFSLKCKDLPGRKHVYQVFGKMNELLMEHPILATIDSETIRIIGRKLPKENENMILEQGIEALRLLTRNGVKFKQDIEIVGIAYHSLYKAWSGLSDLDAAKRTEVIDIMLRGMIDQTVIE